MVRVSDAGLRPRVMQKVHVPEPFFSFQCDRHLSRLLKEDKQ
jgi:hypothetical protein